MIKLHHGECIEVMKSIPDSSIDLILCDLPYGKTKNEWDKIIPFDALWGQYKRLAKPNCPIVLFGSQPFTSHLILSNLKMYRHAWVWNKNNGAGFGTVKLRPFAICEDIVVFSKKKANYFPQMETRGKPRLTGGYSHSKNYSFVPSDKPERRGNVYYPKNLLNFSNAYQVGKLHPTAKPVPLLEYLILTYSKENDVVLDNCMGSGSTGVACRNTNRQFIGIESDGNYFGIAKK